VSVSSGTGSPVLSRTKGRKTLLCVVFCVSFVSFFVFFFVIVTLVVCISAVDCVDTRLSNDCYVYRVLKCCLLTQKQTSNLPKKRNLAG